MNLKNVLTREKYIPHLDWTSNGWALIGYFKAELAMTLVKPGS